MCLIKYKIFQIHEHVFVYESPFSQKYMCFFVSQGKVLYENVQKNIMKKKLTRFVTEGLWTLTSEHIKGWYQLLLNTRTCSYKSKQVCDLFLSELAWYCSISILRAGNKEREIFYKMEKVKIFFLFNSLNPQSQK